MADEYIGEFYDDTANVVFSVFRITTEPGFYKVTGYDGKRSTEVCTFRPGLEPAWQGRWQRHNRRAEINAKATRIARGEAVEP